VKSGDVYDSVAENLPQPPQGPSRALASKHTPRQFKFILLKPSPSDPLFFIMRLPPLSTCLSARHSRFFASNTASGPLPPSHRHTYFVPRNSRGSLPVYSDVRNGGTQYLISVRNVDGNIKALADDLLRDLSDLQSSTESSLIKARIPDQNSSCLAALDGNTLSWTG